MQRRRSSSRGVTPFAAALALAGVGAGISCVWWLGGPSKSESEASSRADATQILSAATSYRAQHAEGCPTISLLQQEQLLARGARGDDAWGNRFRVRCEDAEISVISAGPDSKSNTADDLRVTR